MNGVFILHEGVDQTIFRSQVHRHVIEMEQKGVALTIVAFEPNKKNWPHSQAESAHIRAEYPDVSIHLFRCMNLFAPFAMLINTIILIWRLKVLRNSIPFAFIHARADHTTALCAIAKNILGVKLVWDCRGHSTAELDSLIERKLPKWLLGARTYFRLRQSLIHVLCQKFSNRAIFVSDALRALFPKYPENQCHVIPCSVSEDMFYISPELRDTYRQELGFKRQQVVLLYAGGLAAYQSLHLLIPIFEDVAQNPDFGILFVTPDPQKAAEYFGNGLAQNMTIVAGQFSQMNGYYNAADVGLLLRDHDAINWVASPTKFGEYCLTGLTVVANDAVQQVAQKALAFGNLVAPQDVPDALGTLAPRGDTALAATRVFGRKTVNNLYFALYDGLKIQQPRPL